MAKASLTKVFDVDINKFYEIIVDYDSYPDFVDGVSEVNVLKNSEKGAKVEYHLNLIKQFTYTLELTHKKPNSVSWKLVSGDLFKSNVGAWTLKDLGKGKTEVTYELDVTFKGFAPKMITDKLVKTNLPSMMQSYYERAKDL